MATADGLEVWAEGKRGIKNMSCFVLFVVDLLNKLQSEYPG